MYKFVATALPDLPVAEDVIKDILADEGQLTIVPLPFHSLKGFSYPQWLPKLIEADAILVRSGIVDKYLIDKLKNCKVITLHGVGVDQVDVSYCYKKGIKVTNVPAGNANATAELTVSLMLDSLRSVSKADAYIRSGDWDNGRKLGNELSSQRIGVIGLGNIGARVAEICKAFGAQVMYYDKYRNNNDYKRVSLNELCEWASILTIHIPLNSDTKDLIKMKQLELLGEQGILVNAARGAIVHEESVVYCLANNLIKHYAADVFKIEPPDFTSKLFSLKNTTFTPHIAGSTYECLSNIASRATQDMLRVCKDNEPIHIVNV